MSPQKATKKLRLTKTVTTIQHTHHRHTSQYHFQSSLTTIGLSTQPNYTITSTFKQPENKVKL
ncbi:hypothetical protein Hanom_Chr06g00488021 [Helianthus anomalus]